MLANLSKSRSLAKQFRRDYLLVAIIPLLIMFSLALIGTTITRNYLANLIVHATADLNHDAEQNLQKLGERIIQIKARDVAKQIEIYFRAHPHTDIKQMRLDPQFLKLALQKVGETGYTAIYEAGTWIFRVHPDAKLIDRDVSYLAKDLPSWWKLVGATHSGDEVSGYYDWYDPDGTIHKKYMTITPTYPPLNGRIMMVAATTYIDEFSAPIVEMNNRANKIVEQYQTYVSRQWFIFSSIALTVILLTYSGIFFLGRRAASRYIDPIVRLAGAARELGTGKWDTADHAEIVRRKDEIGILAQAISRMSAQLKELFLRLEQRVAELNETQEALKDSKEHFKSLYAESKRAEEVYRSLIHSSADAIAICDLDGCVNYISPMFTKIFGWTADELTGKPIEFVPEPEQASTAAIIKDVVENGVPCHGFETRRSTKDERLIDVSISASRYDDHQGNPAGMLTIFRDITEKKRLEAQFQHIERMEAVGTLAGGIAHDFNNLLMVIQGSVTLLMKNSASSDPNHRFLSNIEKQVQRGAKLTSQLLGYARKGKYEVKAINVNDIIMETTETFRRTRKDISVHFDLAPDLDAIEADIYQIEQVLMNLYINASDAMPDGGDLFLTTQNVGPGTMAQITHSPQTGDSILLRIKDTGIGMDQKTMDKIFDPFFTTKPMGRGTGLGLASVYGIVKGHDGYIQVDSREGGGTTFSIYLPATKRAVELATPRFKEVAKGAGTVLVVDDEMLVLEICASMVKALGYTVLTADNGRKALEIYAAQADRIDLIILDMIMPDMGGSAAFDGLREINPNAAILLSSGYSIDGKAAEILNRGCKGFVQKPYTVEQLSEKIERIMKNL